MAYLLTDILNNANSIEDHETRAQYMKQFMIYPLIVTLAAFHNKNIQFEKFEEKNLRYKRKEKNNIMLADSKIEVQLRKLYIFQKSYPLPYEEKKKTLEKLLDYLCKEEQELYLIILKQKNPYKNITRPFLKNYFPEILEFTEIKKP